MLVLGVLLLAVIGIFVYQNRGDVTITFLGWQYNTLLGWAMLAAGLAGALIIYISGVLAQSRLRSQLRNTETRLKETEQQLKAAASQIPQITYGERE